MFKQEHKYVYGRRIGDPSNAYHQYFKQEFIFNTFKEALLFKRLVTTRRDFLNQVYDLAAGIDTSFDKAKADKYVAKQKASLLEGLLIWHTAEQKLGWIEALPEYLSYLKAYQTTNFVAYDDLWNDLEIRKVEALIQVEEYS